MSVIMAQETHTYTHTAHQRIPISSSTPAVSEFLNYILGTGLRKRSRTQPLKLCSVSKGNLSADQY